MNFDTSEIRAGKDFLEHYGRKGMKWYQHIFGEEQSHAKYAQGKTSETKKSKKPSAVTKVKEKLSAKRQALKAQAAAKRRQEILKDPNKLFKYRNEFTKEEIDEAMKTFDWEKKLKSYATERNEAIAKSFEQGKRVVDSLLGITKSGISTYNQIVRIYNTFSGDNEIPYVKKDPEGQEQGKKKE